jgi:hypothetical protein
MHSKYLEINFPQKKINCDFSLCRILWLLLRSENWDANIRKQICEGNKIMMKLLNLVTESHFNTDTLVITYE